MDEFDIETLTTPALDEPVLVEGLPGVGHVGKLAAEHLLEEFDAEPVAHVYSEHFPPQVTVEDGTAALARAEFHAVEAGGTDLLVLTGDHQAGDGPGHYRLTARLLDVAADLGCERVYALGGVPTGELIDEYDVLGAATSDALVDRLREVGVEFRDDEPAGGIVGVSGLLLGLGGRRGFEAGCLMGETSGYLVDPKSAQAVLDALGDLLGFEVGYGALADRAEEMEEVMEKMHELQGGDRAPAPGDEDLRYIG